ncbi:MAG: hypothetical protein IE881_06355 [Epsilonproteobacteria bacterium]|nr:hypothetical protein [Campylobacterota bacterium]
MSGGSNPFDTSINLGVGKFSNLQKNQVFKGNNPFEAKNVWKNEDVYGSKDIWGKKNPYRTDNVYADNGTTKEKPRFRRFADLKILNELMMHMSNNTLPDDTRIEILSQGEKGEIKNILAYRIMKISLVPALMSILFGLVLVFTNHIIITFFMLMIYVAVLVRTFFYPAKLYYANIKLKTTRPAKIFFEEMDYWYKLSVVKVYLYLVIVSIMLFIASFYEDKVITFLIENTASLKKSISSESIQFFLESINFSYSLKMLAVFNIALLAYYSRFVNQEKSKAEKELRNRMKNIRNESISRVKQIQTDKNELE